MPGNPLPKLNLLLRGGEFSKKWKKYNKTNTKQTNMPEVGAKALEHLALRAFISDGDINVAPCSTQFFYNPVQNCHVIVQHSFCIAN